MLGQAHHRWTLPIVAIGIAIAIALSLIVVSPSFVKCPYNYQNENNGRPGDKISSPLPIFLLCVGHSIGKNDGVITAIATIFIAAFTIVLANISRDQFNATYRPKIATRAFAFDWREFNVEEQYPISFIYCNEGSSPAKIIEIGTAIIYSDEYNRIDTNFPGFKIRKIGKILGAGAQDIGYSADVVCTNNIFRDQVSRKTRRQVFGRIYCLRRSAWYQKAYWVFSAMQSLFELGALPQRRI